MEGDAKEWFVIWGLPRRRSSGGCSNGRKDEATVGGQPNGRWEMRRRWERQRRDKGAKSLGGSRRRFGAPAEGLAESDSGSNAIDRRGAPGGRSSSSASSQRAGASPRRLRGAEPWRPPSSGFDVIVL